MLCLHSFRGSAAALDAQLALARWREDYASECEFACVDAPHEASGQSAKEIETLCANSAGRFEWWNAREDANGAVEYDGLAEALRAIDSACATASARGEPFDGVMGFSQGATLAAIALASKEIGERFTFGVFVSGMVSRASATERFVWANVRAPTLHVIGVRDDVMPRTLSEGLFRAFANSPATLATHAGGHAVPRFDESGRPILRDFLDSLARAR